MPHDTPRLYEDDLYLLQLAFDSIPPFAFSVDFIAKYEELRRLVDSSDDSVDQIITASVTYNQLQVLLRYVYDLCCELRLRTVLPTIISPDVEHIDTIINYIVSDEDIKQRARSLRDTGRLAFMNELIKRLRRDTESSLRPQIYSLLQDLGEHSDDLPAGLWLQDVKRDRKFKWAGEADIWLGYHHDRRVVLRDLRFAGESEIQRTNTMHHIRREVLATCLISHPNILPFIGVCADTNHPLSIVTAYAERGNAREYLSINPDCLFHIARGTASAVSFLHASKPPLIHGDIKGSNILVSRNGDALLSDFGLARLHHDLTRTLSRDDEVKQAGSVRFSAPELLNGEVLKWTADSDRYSLAMTFLELVTNDYPFREISNEYKMIVAVCCGVRPQRPKTLVILPQQDANYLWSLLVAMWNQNPSERLAMHFVEQYLAVLDSPTGPQTDLIPNTKVYSYPSPAPAPTSPHPPRVPVFPHPGSSLGLPILPPATSTTPTIPPSAVFHVDILDRSDNDRNLKGNPTNDSFVQPLTPTTKTSSSIALPRLALGTRSHLSRAPPRRLGMTLEDGTPVLFHVRALYAYSAADDVDLDLQVGDIIAVTATPDHGWWSGVHLDAARRMQGRTVFPCNFVSWHRHR